MSHQDQGVNINKTFRFPTGRVEYNCFQRAPFYPLSIFVKKSANIEQFNAQNELE